MHHHTAQKDTLIQTRGALQRSDTKCVTILQLSKSEIRAELQTLTMDSRADMRNVTTILLSEDSSSSAGSADIATWAMISAEENTREVSGGAPHGQCSMHAAIVYSVIAAQTPLRYVLNFPGRVISIKLAQHHTPTKTQMASRPSDMFSRESSHTS